MPEKQIPQIISANLYICFSLSDLLHSVWQILVSSTSLQMTQLCSFSLLSNIPFTYVPCLLYPFICLWLFRKRTLTTFASTGPWKQRFRMLMWYVFLLFWLFVRVPRISLSAPVLRESRFQPMGILTTKPKIGKEKLSSTFLGSPGLIIKLIWA